MKLQPRTALRGEVELPADKSISHRSALLAAVADGTTPIDNYADSDDCRSTLECLAGLGVRMSREGTRVTIEGRSEEHTSELQSH